MDKSKTPITEAIEYLSKGKELAESLNNTQQVAAFNFCLEELRLKLPAEREHIERAHDDGYCNGMDNPGKCDLDYFTNKYEPLITLP